MSDEKDEKLHAEGEAKQAEAETPDAEGEAKQQAKPKRRVRRKKADTPQSTGEPAADAKGEAQQADAAADDDAESEPKDKPKRQRRGSAETTTTAKRATVPAPRGRDGRIEVRAQARYVRCAPRKARLVVDHIRGKSVEDARAILATTPRAAARDVLKLLDSAIANAENNHELVADELTVGKAYVDEGPTIKRFRPRAQGRATRINKRTSHMTILLTTKEDA